MSGHSLWMELWREAKPSADRARTAIWPFTRHLENSLAKAIARARPKPRLAPVMTEKVRLPWLNIWAPAFVRKSQYFLSRSQSLILLKTLRPTNKFFTRTSTTSACWPELVTSPSVSPLKRLVVLAEHKMFSKESKACFVVTGASRGFGRAVALALADEFYQCSEKSAFVLAARSAEGLQETERQILQKYKGIEGMCIKPYNPIVPRNIQSTPSCRGTFSQPSLVNMKWFAFSAS